MAGRPNSRYFKESRRDGSREAEEHCRATWGSTIATGKGVRVGQAHLRSEYEVVRAAIHQSIINYLVSVAIEQKQICF